MRSGNPRLIRLSLVLLTFTLIQLAPVNAQTVVQNPDDVLAAATAASLDANYKLALTKSREARAAGKGDLSFAVRFIDAVASIADLSDERHRSAILNEALKAANEVEISKAGSGTQDAEFAWHYMVAIGKLADSISEVSSDTARKLYLAQANVAKNLRANAAFPQESLSLLAEPLMNRALAKAIAKDTAGTLEAMNSAFDAGFTNFERLSENQFLKALESKEVTALVSSKLLAHKRELMKWARESVTKFKSFDFKFDVADIDAGRIRNSDFQGRILVLDLWATWCPPCREAIPHFVKLDKTFRRSNVDVVGISMDNPDQPRKSVKIVRKFIDDNDVEYAVAMGDRSVMNQLAPEQKLPTVLFIDTQGKVRYIAEGPHSFLQLAAITNELIRREKVSPTSVPLFSNL